MVLHHQLRRLTLLIPLVFWLTSSTARAKGAEESPCTITSGQRTVTLNIEPKPVRAMQELTFTLTVRPCDALPASLLLDLSMPGMEMGKNQVTLHKTNDGRYEGKGVIIRCMSHHTLWRVTIVSDELHNPAFTINVRE